MPKPKVKAEIEANPGLGDVLKKAGIYPKPKSKKTKKTK